MNTPIHFKSRKILLIPLLFVIAISLMWACGPWFPDWLLTQGDLELLRPPTTHYQNEVDRLTTEFPSAYVTVVPETSKQEQTTGKAIEDLRAALKEQSLPLQEIESILHQHQASRKAVEVYRREFKRYEAFKDSPWFQEEVKLPSLTPPTVSKKLPLEFSLYFRGAIDYHQNQHQKAKKHWEDVLNLPEQDRLYRSTWAAFMLGRLDVDQAPDQAISRFQQVRKLVDEGHKDSLGLGAASLGWEARAWFHQKQYRKAIELYLEQMASGDPHSARISIRWVVAEALSDSPAGLQDLASTPAIRRITTAYLASINTLRWDWNEQEDVELVRAWVDAVEEAGVQEYSLFEPMALAVYQRGFYDLSERLLTKAPEDGVLRTWLKSKLLFRKGNIEKATTLLAKVAGSFPVHDESNEGNHVDRTSSNQPLQELDLIYRTELKETSHRPNGEWAILLLHRGEYIQSLDTLLRAGYWMDAAYIAERVLSTDELKNYVDENWPAKQKTLEEESFNPEYPPSAWNRNASDDAKHFQIRYLLARR